MIFRRKDLQTLALDVLDEWKTNGLEPSFLLKITFWSYFSKGFFPQTIILIFTIMD